MIAEIGHDRRADCAHQRDDGEGEQRRDAAIAISKNCRSRKNCANRMEIALQPKARNQTLIGT
jgi:hypothetical protein